MSGKKALSAKDDILNTWLETDIEGGLRQWVEDNPTLTIKRAVRRMCVSCYGGKTDKWTRNMIATCSASECPLRPVRPYFEDARRAVLKDIRAMCLFCSTDDFGVRHCHDRSCPLWGYRFGKNPRFSEETREKYRQLRIAQLEKERECRETPHQ